MHTVSSCLRSRAVDAGHFPRIRCVVRRWPESKAVTQSAAGLTALFILVCLAIGRAIVWLRVNPAIALLCGTIVLGLASGMSFADVVHGVNQGFGALVAELGLLISLGIVMGTLMSVYGAVERIAGSIVKLSGSKGSPNAFSLTLSTVTPSIDCDVLLALVAPIARTAARRTGRPVASLVGPVAMGLAAGSALVIPGPAMLVYIGMLELTAGEMLLPGLLAAIPAVMVTTFAYLLLIERGGCWKTTLDEDIADEAVPGLPRTTATPAVGFPRCS
nr:SLC13 family permease [Agrococcus sp. KRD186]